MRERLPSLPIRDVLIEVVVMKFIGLVAVEAEL